MILKWIDSEDIAIALEEAYPKTPVLGLRFTQLRQLVLGLPQFDDNPDHCNERILEAIQMAWLSEQNDQ